jgi:uncharacterized membrane protein
MYLLLRPVGTAAAIAVAALIGLDTSCLTYILATWRAFAGAPADVLAELIRPTTAPAWVFILRGGSNGPAIAVLVACIGLIAAALLPRLDRVGTGQVTTGALLGLSVLSLALCWLVLVVGFAVHYVRVHVRQGGLQFPGTESPTFGDYLYFSVAVATTFGTTDVTVADSRLRRVVAGQGLLAFVFNTVILALVVNIVSR